MTIPLSSAWAESERPEGQALRLLWARRGLVSLFALVFAAGALALSLMSANAWESTAVVRLGQVGQTGQVGQAGPTLVEPIARAVSRVQMRRFQDSTLEELHLPSGENDRVARLYRRSLAAKPTTGTDLVAVEVRGFSPDEARRLLQATVDHLSRVHSEIAAPSIRNLQAQAAQVGDQLASSQNEITQMRVLEQAGQKAAGGGRFDERVYLAGVIAKRLEDVRLLTHQKDALDEQLNPARTYPTSLVDPVRVDPKPVSPKPLRNTLLALLVGGLFGAFVVFLLDLFRGRGAAIESAPAAAAEPIDALRRNER
jgi:LPS O-antigen subunit length determinant protein (WzzB/FepE family)